MPFEITIKINNSEKLCVFGRNFGPPGGDKDNPTRVYRFSVEKLEDFAVTDGEVLHVRDEGMAKLAAIILYEVAKKAKLLQQKMEGSMSREADLVEKSIMKTMMTYDLSKAFERGLVTCPATGEVKERWRPTQDITRQDYSSGERVIVAILLDRFHQEFGVLGYLEEQTLAEAREKDELPATLIWPGVATFRELDILDNELAEVVAELLAE